MSQSLRPPPPLIVIKLDDEKLFRDMDFFGSPNYETGRSNTGRSDEATELILRQQSTTT